MTRCSISSCAIASSSAYFSFFFFFNDTATTEIYTLSLHDALPISDRRCRGVAPARGARVPDRGGPVRGGVVDRKSTRLNSSHGYISYAVFCLKKKKKTENSQAAASRCACVCDPPCPSHLLS